MSKRNAFTLIELLVVIAIIAILAAILFPVFAQAKVAAKRTNIISNMKQIQLASQIYLSDYDDVYHRIRNFYGTGNYGDPNWAFGAHHALEPYMKNRDIFKSSLDPIERNDCDPTHGGAVSFGWTHYQAGYDQLQTYGIHAYYSAETSFAATAVGRPAETINLYELWTTHSYWESYGYWRWNTHDLRTFPAYPQAFSFNWCGTGDGRLTMGNSEGNFIYGFADGHVKTLRRTQIAPQVWNQAAYDNNERNLVHYDERFKS